MLENLPDLCLKDQNLIKITISTSIHEGHYFLGMILINRMGFRVLLHEFFHHIFWNLKFPHIFHELLDFLDVVLRRSVNSQQFEEYILWGCPSGETQTYES